MQYMVTEIDSNLGCSLGIQQKICKQHKIVFSSHVSYQDKIGILQMTFRLMQNIHDTLIHSYNKS